ncbi:GumC family protein [Rhizobium sp. RCAM05350]|nr:GumC family protein [Rhizobium sp. RCAM05350]
MVLTVAGAIGGVLLAISTPSVYVSQSKLYVDPREVRLTDSDLSKESLATEAILALVDSQLEVLRSRTVLEKVAIDLGLDHDPEFGGVSSGKGGIADGIDVIHDIVAPGKAQPAPASGVNPRTLEKLSDAVTVSADPKTFIVTIEVKSRDPAKSALITNRLVATFLNEEQAAQSGFFQRTTKALDSRLTDLRKELDTAENAVEKFKADHDIVGAAGELIFDKQLLALNDQVGAVRNRIADARAKADLATKIRLNDVLSGAFPEEVSSVTLQELRKQYSEAQLLARWMRASARVTHNGWPPSNRLRLRARRSAMSFGASRRRRRLNWTGPSGRKRSCPATGGPKGAADEFIHRLHRVARTGAQGQCDADDL